LEKPYKKKFILFGALAATGAALATAFSFIFLKREKKEVTVNGKKQMLYPQDIVLNKTLLRIIPDYIWPTYFSFIRILLAPVVAYYVAFGESLVFALILYSLISFTDTIDGALARTRDQITDLGKIIDPIADKLLFGLTGIFVLPQFGHTKLLLIIIGMELGVVVVGYFFVKNKAEMAANIFGKIKLVLQVIGMLLFVIAKYTKAEDIIQAGVTILICSIIFHIFAIIKFLYDANKHIS
jgi:CDP-diacylglycerol---glycerol-3-phosphate 3-phosphatidyltransferase